MHCLLELSAVHLLYDLELLFFGNSNGTVANCEVFSDVRVLRPGPPLSFQLHKPCFPRIIGLKQFSAQVATLYRANCFNCNRCKSTNPW